MYSSDTLCYWELSNLLTVIRTKSTDFTHLWHCPLHKQKDVLPKEGQFEHKGQTLVGCTHAFATGKWEGPTGGSEKRNEVLPSHHIWGADGTGRWKRLGSRWSSLRCESRARCWEGATFIKMTAFGKWNKDTTCNTKNTRNHKDYRLCECSAGAQYRSRTHHACVSPAGWVARSQTLRESLQHPLCLHRKLPGKLWPCPCAHCALSRAASSSVRPFLQPLFGIRYFLLTQPWDGTDLWHLIAPLRDNSKSIRGYNQDHFFESNYLSLQAC